MVAVVRVDGDSDPQGWSWELEFYCEKHGLIILVDLSPPRECPRCVRKLKLV